MAYLFGSSVIVKLQAVALEIAQGFAHGVAAELVERAPGQSERDHGLARDTRGWDHTDVGALVGGTYGLACREIDGLQRTAQGGDRFQVAAHANFFAVGNATFDATGVVARTGDSANAGRFVVSDFIM